MARFYNRRIVFDDASTTYLVTIREPGKNPVEIEVPKELFDEMEELQREHWRLERRESRHSVHLDAIPDRYIPHERYVKNPEEILVEQIEATEIRSALHQIPVLQQRRFLLRHLIGLTVKQIAEIEGCTVRAVEYSLVVARNNLQRIFLEKEG